MTKKKFQLFKLKLSQLEIRAVFQTSVLFEYSDSAVFAALFFDWFDFNPDMLNFYFGKFTHLPTAG